MPFRQDEHACKIQFSTSREMPYLIYQACLATGTVSNTVYIQHAIAEALARDLGVTVESIIEKLPPARSRSKHLFHPDDPNSLRTRFPIHQQQDGGVIRYGQGNTNEDVK